MKSHRGLSSAVGAVFLIIVLTTGMTYVATSINTIGDFSEQVIVQDTQRMEKEKESFEITFIDIKSGKLEGVIQNTGQVPLKITKLWIDEKGIPDEVQKISVDAAAGIGDTINLIDFIDYNMDPLKGYNMKFVTSRGEVQSYFVNSSDEIKLHTQLNALPETIPIGFDTIILFTVTNNSTNNNALLNVTPTIEVKDPNGVVVQECTPLPTCPSIPPSYPSLKPGESTTFKWVYTINGESSYYEDFTVQLQNGHPDNVEIIRVKITDIQFASVAATASSSQTFNPVSSSTGNLVLHQEIVEKIPTGYQLEQKLADGGGMDIVLDEDNLMSPKFFTNNGTAVDIDEDIWEVNLVYYSEPFPKILENSMNSGGMIFHFEDNGEGDDGYEDNSFDCMDSTGKGKFADYRGLPAVWNSFGGPNNTGSYTFDGSEDHFRIEIADCNDLSNTPTTIAGWFKASSSGSGDDYIYFAGKDKDNDDRFAVMIDGGDDVEFSVHTDANDTAICNSINDTAPPSPINYRDDQWHHFVGVRESDDSCLLYIDGVEVHTAGGSGGGSFIETQSPYVYVGARLDEKNHPYPTTDYFEGQLDDIMYWNNYALSATQAGDLYNTSYGENAHEMTFTFSTTDGLGANSVTIFTESDYKMNFLDGKRDNKAVKSFKYSSATQPLARTILDQERIKLLMGFDTRTLPAINMKMTLRIDDNSLTETSYMDLPLSVGASFHPSTTHDNDSKFTTGITSSGPHGAWLTKAGTRIILTNIDTEISYAGIIEKVNTVTLSESEDSIFIQEEDQVDLVFHRITLSPNYCLPNPPTELCSNDIPPPPGEYDGQILMIGYNDQGNQNTWKVDLGKIKVID